MMKTGSALIVVDVQNDFLPGGALPITEGDQIIPVLNRYLELSQQLNLPILATRDWHPAETVHFVSGGGVWPPHCVAGTAGADFGPGLNLPETTTVVSKGLDPQADSYSGFEARDEEGRALAEILKDQLVDTVLIGGLATDYCVMHTALDAVQAGFKAFVLLDAVRGVNLGVHDSEQALQSMCDSGVGFATISRV